MAFDLSTAKPVQKFDISTAKPVEIGTKQRGILDISPEEQLSGVAEAGTTLLTGALAEPAAGIAGIAGAVLPGPAGQGAGFVEATREALTFRPRGEVGQKIVQAGGEAFQASGIPQGLQFIEKALGDIGFSLAGPVGGAVGTAIPTAALEAIGLKGIASIRGAKQIKGIPDEVAKNLDEAGISVDDLSDANVQAIQTKAAEQIQTQEARIKVFQEQDIRPTRAQVTRDAGEFQTQQELAKTQTPVREALETQEGLLTDRFNEKVKGTGGQPVTSGSTVTDTVTNRSITLDNQISDLYTQARETAAGEKNVRLERTGKLLKDLAPGDRAAGGNIRAIAGDLQAKGVMDDNFKIVGRIDVTTAEDVRQLANELFDPQKPFGNQKLREIKQALDDDVLSVAGEDVFKQARKAKADFERGLSRARVNKFDSRKTNLVRDVLENKIDPDSLAKDITQSKKYRAEDLNQLKDYLQQDAPGKTAFDDLRAEVMNDIKELSFIGPEDASGNRALSRNALQKTLEKIGKPRLAVLFNAQERKFLDQMLTVAKLREPVRGTALGRGPSSQAIQSLERNILRNPLLNDVWKGITRAISENVRSRGALTIPAPSADIRTTLRPIPAAAAVLAPAALSNTGTP